MILMWKSSIFANLRGWHFFGGPACTHLPKQAEIRM